MDATVGYVTHVLASVILTISATVFGAYAARNVRFEWLEPTSRRWVYLSLAGGSGALYGGFRVLGAAFADPFAGVSAALQSGAAIFVTLFLAFAVRDAYFDGLFAPPPGERLVSDRTFRRFEAALLGLVAVAWWTTFFADGGSPTLAGFGIAGLLGFTAYGFVFGGLLVSRARGSTLDTLLRHLLPALGCFGVVGLAQLAATLGVASGVVAGIIDVATLLAATFLFTATIGLKQNVERFDFSGTGS